MAEDLTNFEAYLRSLSPSSPNPDLAKRLNLAASQTATDLTIEELEMESTLAALRPHRLSAAYQHQLLAAMGTVEPKVLKPATKINWLAAAAVAVLGGFTAFMVPGSNGPSQNKLAQTPPATASPSLNIQPAGLIRNLASAKDEGVVWPDGKAPHRILRVTYNDQVTLKDKDGRLIEIQQPCVEYILVPAKID